MKRELPITNSSGRDQRLWLRPHTADEGSGTRLYLMPAGDGWLIIAPSRSATFEVQIEPDAITIVIAGCDINAVDVQEQMLFERPMRLITPVNE